MTEECQKVNLKMCINVICTFCSRAKHRDQLEGYAHDLREKESQDGGLGQGTSRGGGKKQNRFGH